MSVDTNRLLMAVERAMRMPNREVINPDFEELKVADLEPVLKLVARARADYLKRLFEIADDSSEGLPGAGHIAELKQLRMTYEELVSASQALNTAIERGYLDVSSP